MWQSRSDTVQEYPGGSESLAPRMSNGMSAATLRGKVNPNNDRNLLSLQEANELMGKSGDYRILHAMAADHGFVVQRVDATQKRTLPPSSRASLSGSASTTSR